MHSSSLLGAKRCCCQASAPACTLLSCNTVLNTHSLPATGAQAKFMLPHALQLRAVFTAEALMRAFKGMTFRNWLCS